MSVTLPRPSLSESDRRCVAFARACADHGIDPADLAVLCALARKAAAGGTRECNIPNYSADKARARCATHARSMGLSTEWDGLWPTFRLLNGEEVRVPH